MSRTCAFTLWAFCLVGMAIADEPANDLSLRLSTTQVLPYATANGYSEGPSWKNGEVFFCSGCLWRVDKNKKAGKFLEISPAGTFLRANGDLLVCDNKHHGILNINLTDGEIDVIADQFEGQPLKSLNDISVDNFGNIYWTDPAGSSVAKPTGNIFRVTPAGLVEKVATGLAFPNGLEVDPSSQFLYVIESQSRKILRYPLSPDSPVLGTPAVFYDLGGSGGDGCAFDAQGNLWVADFHRPETGRGRITVLSSSAEVLGHLNVPAKVVSNIAFGGTDYDEIYCTTGGPPGVFHAKVKVKGFPGHPAKEVKRARRLELKPQHK